MPRPQQTAMGRVTGDVYRSPRPQSDSEPQKVPIRRAPAAIVLVLLCVAVPGIVWFSVPASEGDWIVAWPIFVLLYSGIRLASLSTLAFGRPVTMTFWVFSYVFLGLAPLVQVQAGAFPWVPVSRLEAVLPRAYVSVLIGLVVFDLFASYSVKRVHRGSHVFLQRPLFFRNVAALGMLGGALAFFVASRTGGLGSLFISRFESSSRLAGLVETSLKSGPVAAALLRVPVSVALIAILLFATSQYRSKGAVSRSVRIALAGVGVVAIALVNPIATPRYWFGTVVLAGLLVLLPLRSQRRKATWTIGLVLAIVLVFPLASTFRWSTEVSLAEVAGSFSPIGHLTTSGDFDAIQQTAATVDITLRQGYEWGSQTAGSLLFWIPRPLWPSKPEPGGVRVAEYLGLRFTNLSMPLWAVLYLDGGVVFVAVGMAAYGFLVGTLESAYARSRGVTVVALLVPLFAGYQFFLLRGDLMPALAFLAPALLCILLLQWPIPPDLGTRRYRRSRRTHDNLR